MYKFATLLLACVAVQCAHGQQCQTGWFAHGASCYMLIKSADPSWAQAQLACRSAGAHLASIHSMSLNQILWHYAINNGVTSSVWIGLSRAPSSSTWTWSDGTPLDFTNWGPGQPNNDNSDEYWVEMIPGSSPYNFNGQWNDFTPTNPSASCPMGGTECSVSGFFCEINAAPPMNSTATTATTTMRTIPMAVATLPQTECCVDIIVIVDSSESMQLAFYSMQQFLFNNFIPSFQFSSSGARLAAIVFNAQIVTQYTFDFTYPQSNQALTQKVQSWGFYTDLSNPNRCSTCALCTHVVLVHSNWPLRSFRVSRATHRRHQRQLSTSRMECRPFYALLLHFSATTHNSKAPWPRQHRSALSSALKSSVLVSRA